MGHNALMLAAARTVSLGSVVNKARTPVCKAIKPSGPRSFGAQSRPRINQPARLSRRPVVTKAGILDSVLGCGHTTAPLVRSDAKMDMTLFQFP